MSASARIAFIASAIFRERCQVWRRLSCEKFASDAHFKVVSVAGVVDGCQKQVYRICVVTNVIFKYMYRHENNSTILVFNVCVSVCVVSVCAPSRRVYVFVCV
jgi:hypothetical protein